MNFFFMIDQGSDSRVRQLCVFNMPSDSGMAARAPSLALISSQQTLPPQSHILSTWEESLLLL